jgi:hypothetical protein
MLNHLRDLDVLLKLLKGENERLLIEEERLKSYCDKFSNLRLDVVPIVLGSSSLLEIPNYCLIQFEQAINR